MANECFKYTRNINDEEIVNQIELINSTNNILTSYCDNNTLRIPGNLGRNVESIKVEVKKLKRDLNKREKKKELNEMDKFLLNNGNKILIKVEEALNSLKYIDYVGLMRRSMKNHEVCLGKSDESNLRKNELIEIGTLKKINYNLKEEDIYEYLVKIRKYVENFNEDYYLNEFINISNLENGSREYLNILLSIPIDTLRQWYRYINGKRKVLSVDYLKNIKKCLEYEV